jgi:putative flippase GtrA
MSSLLPISVSSLLRSGIKSDQLLLLKFIKFCVIGFSGMIIDFGTTWLLKEKAGINKYIANSTGFILAATSNYIWNRIWTFQSENQLIVKEYLSFFLIALAGLGINNFIIFLLNDRLGLNFYLAKLIAVGVVTCWNFSMNYLITFR